MTLESDARDGDSTLGLTETDRHRLLVAERRRHALDVLDAERSAMDLDELAAALVAREDGADDADGDATERMRVSLHHQHLPLMARLGVVDYDRDAQRVTLHRAGLPYR